MIFDPKIKEAVNLLHEYSDEKADEMRNRIEEIEDEIQELAEEKDGLEEDLETIETEVFNDPELKSAQQVIDAAYDEIKRIDAAIKSGLVKNIERVERELAEFKAALEKAEREGVKDNDTNEN